MQNNLIESKETIFYDERLWTFGKFLSGPYYQAFFCLKKILLYKKLYFTIDTVKEFYSSYPNVTIKGKLLSISFEEAKKIIAAGLCFRGISHEDTGENTYKYRQFIFWSIIDEAINKLPPDSCFIYDGDVQDVTGNFPWMWDTFLILIKNNQAIFLICSASWD